MSTYSFQSFTMTITGPGGSISLGYGSGNDKGGVTFEMNENANTMSIGADGTPMNSLNPGKGGKVTIRLQKASPTNGLLSAMYNYQRANPANWGQNVLSAADITRGDQYACQTVAFTKFPSNTYAIEGGALEWTFDVGVMDPALATGG
jgi:hypothetical protein